MAVRRVVVFFILLVCGLFLVGSVLAADGVVLRRSVVGGGGGPVTDGSLYLLNGTVSEPVAGVVVVGGSYGLSSGFWWAGGFGGTTVYLPLMLKN
ncbi:MAG: hypothetical protein JW953_12590 [Anaerolineae bacterium]|nr:hypothetical protein [Anaerolineae bacterium]